MLQEYARSVFEKRLRELFKVSDDLLRESNMTYKLTLVYLLRNNVRQVSLDGYWMGKHIAYG